MEAPSQDRSGNPQENAVGRYWILAAIVVLLAAALKLYGINKWNIQYDEMFTVMRVQNPAVDHNYRIQFLGYFPVTLGYWIWGTSYLGLRIGPALLGVLSVVAVLWLAPRTMGRRFALIVAALLVFSYSHSYFSQYSRFYAMAFLINVVFLFAILRAFRDWSLAWGLAAALIGGLEIYAHAMGLLLVFGVMATLFFIGFVPRLRPPGWTFPRYALVGGVMIATMLPGLYWNIFKGKALTEGQGWVYSPFHNAMAILNNMTLPVMCAAAAGFLFMLRDRRWETKVVGVATAFALGALVAMSHFTSIRFDYFYPSCIGVYFLAAWAIERFGGRVRGDRTVMTIFLIVLQAPYLLSYYGNGNRFDYSGAYAYINAQRQPGDKVVAGGDKVAAYYGTPEDVFYKDRLFLEHGEPTISGPAWIMQEVSRSGDDSALNGWLFDHARLAWDSKPRRFDYYEMELRVWYWPGPGEKR